MLGSYTIKVNTSGMPQALASGFDKLFEGMTGASYEFLSYLGSKVTNGINHAILAEQRLIVAKDVRSIVLIVVNQKPEDIKGENLSIVDIRTLVSDGGQKMGGLNISPTTDIPAEIMEVFNKHFNGFLGSNIKPIALLATRVVNGMEYTFAVESEMVINKNSVQSSNNVSINIVRIYSNYNEIKFEEVISGSKDGEGLLEGTASGVKDLWP